MVPSRHLLLWFAVTSAVIFSATPEALFVPPELQLPGSQPGEVSNLGSVSNCDNCHGGYDPAVEPAHNWRGSMMANSARDPMFWATVAVSERDLPGSGDLCIRCHSPRGWLEGRSTPTDGSALTHADVDGTECAVCHALVNPDTSEHAGVQFSPYVANDGGTPPEGFYGSGMFVMRPGNEKLGPYTNSVARHAVLPSRFHRQEEMCGTCHDVSNPFVGDLAHNHGAQVPLDPGSYSGVPGDPVTTKAAFQNPPYRYGVIERTFSEFKASALDTTRVRDYPSLPAELQRGALERAYQQSLLAGSGGDYEDGTPRTFTCQTCHVEPTQGKGADKHNVPFRNDLPFHDFTGGNYWAGELIRYQDARGELVVGGGLDAQQVAALIAGSDRARATLRRAATLAVQGDVARITNLTGHKLPTGFHEGRRMWLHVIWKDASGNVAHEVGEYGPMNVTLEGRSYTVESLLDPEEPDLRLYEAHYGITQEWATELISLGVPASLPLAFDRSNGTILETLADVSAGSPGTAYETLHFVLNNTILSDPRIPPYGFDHDEARVRNALPVPASRFGDPGPGGTYDHHDDILLNPPPQAVFAELELLYQPTSYEYVQFLVLASTGAPPFLAQEGRKLWDAWLATGMAQPELMARTTWCRLRGTEEDFALMTTIDGGGEPRACQKVAAAGSLFEARLHSPSGTFQGANAALVIQLYPTHSPPVGLPGFPGIHVNDLMLTLPFGALPAQGVALPLVVPPGLTGWSARFQGLLLTSAANNGLYVASEAHDVIFR